MQQAVTAEQRRRRANEIIDFLRGAEQIFSRRSQQFLHQITRGPVSPRQLRWLENLRESYLSM